MKKKLSEIIRSRIEVAVDLLSTAVFLLIFLVGFYALVDIHYVHVSAQMDEEIVSLAPDDKGIDIVELQKINPEIRAWIKIPDTKIDYPIVQGANNTKYLTRNYRAEYATAGSIFLDYRNDSFNDDYSLVYGHRMDGQQMFGGIAMFEDAEYFKTHKMGVLYTPDAIYDLEISDYSVVDVHQSTIYQHDDNRNGLNGRIISEVHSFAQQSRPTEYDEDDKIIILSTCDKDSKNYRDVLLAKMIKRE